MAAKGNPVVEFFSSLKLSVVLLFLLGLLTWFGTLEQVEHGLYEVQKKYFESWSSCSTDDGPVSIPLPGANLVLCVALREPARGRLVLRMRRREQVGHGSGCSIVTRSASLLMLVAAAS